MYNKSEDLFDRGNICYLEEIESTQDLSPMYLDEDSPDVYEQMNLNLY